MLFWLRLPANKNVSLELLDFLGRFVLHEIYKSVFSVFPLVG